MFLCHVSLLFEVLFFYSLVKQLYYVIHKWVHIEFYVIISVHKALAHLSNFQFSNSISIAWNCGVTYGGWYLSPVINYSPKSQRILSIQGSMVGECLLVHTLRSFDFCPFFPPQKTLLINYSEYCPQLTIICTII